MSEFRLLLDRDIIYEQPLKSFLEISRSFILCKWRNSFCENSNGGRNLLIIRYLDHYHICVSTLRRPTSSSSSSSLLLIFAIPFNALRGGKKLHAHKMEKNNCPINHRKIQFKVHPKVFYSPFNYSRTFWIHLQRSQFYFKTLIQLSVFKFSSS